MTGKSRTIALRGSWLAFAALLFSLAFSSVSMASGPPKAKTEAATGVRATQATLNGTVNPEGLTTGSHFECGETTSYGINIGYKAGLTGTSNVSVSESFTIFKPGTTYHCRLVASNSAGTTNGEDISFKTQAGIGGSQLAALSVIEPFNASSASLANFESNFGTLATSVGGYERVKPKGEDYSNGWGPWDTYPAQNGTYYKPTFTDIGWGVANVATLNAIPTNLVERYFSLWVDMPTPESSSIGYEVRFTTVSKNVFNVALYKWGGTPKELASKASYSLSNGSSIALVDQGSKVSAWVDSGSGFAEILSATDETFASGSVALQGATNSVRMANFRAGALRAPRATTEAATEVQVFSVKLNGTINPEGLATKYYFEYGPTTSYGTKIPVSAKEAGSGTSNVTVQEQPLALTPGATYHYRLVAENEAGQRKGEDKTVTTLKEPKATTEAATEVTESSATLNGTVNPEGAAASYYFEYGIGSPSESKIPTSAKEVGSGTSNVSVHETLTGLSAGKTYHYRLVAVNYGDTVWGGEKTFSTPAQTTLCKTNPTESLCPKESRYPAETTINAEISKFRLTSSIITVECASQLSAASESEADAPLALDIQLTFSKCSGGCTVKQLEEEPAVGSLAWSEGADGKVEYGIQGEAPIFNVHCGFAINCNYRFPDLSLEGGSPAQFSADEQTLVNEGGFSCPPSGTTLKPATYTVTEPTPLYVARAT